MASETWLLPRSRNLQGMLRSCSTCGPTEARFPKVGAVCSPCIAVYKRSYYLKHKGRINAKNSENYHKNYERYSAHKKAKYAVDPEPARKRTRASSAERKHVIDSAKNQPCVDCKQRFPAVCMDFDHRPGEIKVGCVGHLKAWNAPIDIILEEIAKCDVVCSNCHRIRTASRRLEK